MFSRFLIAIGAVSLLATSMPAPVQAASLQERCEDYAYRAAWRRGDRVGEGAVGGAVVGGMLGAILGKGKGKNIVGGAIAGTVAGAALGATSRNDGYISRRAYRIAYRDCVDRSRVRRVRYDDGVEYCLSRFRSYNPSTGLYRTYSGQYRSCP